MPIVATRGNAGAFAYGFTAGAAGEVLGGMVLITPTSVDKTGTGSTATIGTNGSVSFSSCVTLSLNGVFNTDYDNYMIVMRNTLSLGGVQIYFRWRVSGSDNSTANSYVRQYVEANGASVGAGRNTSDLASVTYTDAGENGIMWNVYGPYLAQPTAYRTVTMSSANTVRIQDYAGTHNQSTSYDGFTLFPQSSYSMTGLISVYGLVGT